jgi:hypothetical protein
MMLAEFVLHGWDLARAIGVPYDVPATLGLSGRDPAWRA